MSREFKDIAGTDNGDYLVVGCGPSVKNLDIYCDGTQKIIGVNDVRSHVKNRINYHVVVDRFNQFSSERLAVINDTPSDIMLSQHEYCTTTREYIKLELRRERGFVPFDTVLPISTHSTFVAACVAIKLGAKSLAFSGVDIIGHRNFRKESLITRTRQDLRDLVSYCESVGIWVYNLGDESNIFGGLPVGNGEEYLSYLSRNPR